MTTPLTLTPGHGSDGGVILRFAGEIDMTNTGDFAAALADNPGKLVVDLTHVLYLDSAGLSVLFSHADRIELIITALLQPVVTISGLAALTTVHTAEESDR